MSSSAPSVNDSTLHEKIRSKEEAKKKADVPLGMRKNWCRLCPVECVLLIFKLLIYKLALSWAVKADGTSKRFYKSAGVSEIYQDDLRYELDVTSWSAELD
jgi:hypothetical protein